jgi:Glycosyltransferase family 87
MKRQLHIVLFCLLVAGWIVLLIIQQPPALASDFYPAHFWGQKLIAGQNLYSAETTQELAQQWLSPYVTGFSYPLPMALLFVPLALLPLPLAMCLWTIFGAAGSFAALGLRSDWRKLILLPLVFAPLYLSILVEQSTLIWFALIVIFLFALRRRSSWLVGLSIVLLPIKPQVGLFFALAGLVWAWKNDRRSLYWAGLWGLLVWGTSFVLMPTWPLEWIEQLKLYREANPAPTLLPWSLVLVLVTWKMSWPARLAALQVALFPLNSMYTLLPLLLVWMEIGGPLALIGAGISMLWLAFPSTQSAAVVWALTGTPLIVCAAWRWRQSMQQSMLVAKNAQLERPE